MQEIDFDNLEKYSADAIYYDEGTDLLLSSQSDQGLRGGSARFVRAPPGTSFFSQDSQAKQMALERDHRFEVDANKRVKYDH